MVGKDPGPEILASATSTKDAAGQLSVMSAPVCRLHQGLTARRVRHFRPKSSLLQRQVLKHNYLNAAFVHLLLSSGSSVYWRLLRCNCSHSVFPTCKVVLLVSDGKSILQRHVLKPCCRTVQIYRSLLLLLHCFCECLALLPCTVINFKTSCV